MVAGTSVLGVRSVTVSGLRTLSTEDVIDAAGIRHGQPLLRLDTAAVAGRIQGIPGVSRVAVQRAWPSTVRIVITERKGVAVVTRDGSPWLIDRDGVVFQHLASRPPGLPRLALARVAPTDSVTRAALAAVVALPAALTAQIVAVTAATAESVTLTLTGGRTVVWGGADRGAQKARVLAALLRQSADTPQATRYDISDPSVVAIR